MVGVGPVVDRQPRRRAAVVAASTGSDDLVDDAVAVFVASGGVADLLGPGIDGRICVIAIELADAEEVSVTVSDVGTVAIEDAVLGDAVAAALGSAGIDVRVRVVAVRALGLLRFTVVVDVESAAGQIAAIAVLVDAIAAELDAVGPGAGVAVVAVLVHGRAVVVDVFRKTALVDLAVAVLVDL
jgi:hypothetical protein